MSIYSDDPLRAEPDPNPVPRLVLFGPWDGLQEDAPRVQPQLEMRTCTECHVEMLAASFLQSSGGYWVTCARCRRLSVIRRRAGYYRERIRAGVSAPTVPLSVPPAPPVGTQYCIRCRHWVLLALFEGVDRHGQSTQYLTCSPCRVHHSAYNVAKRAAGHAV